MKRLALLVLCICLVVPSASFCAPEEAQYTGIIGKKMNMYAKASEKSAIVMQLEEGTVADVYAQGKTFTQIGINGQQGYVLTKFIERVQRKNPFDGPMPGTSTLIGLGRLTRQVSFRPEGYKYAVVLTEGSYIAVQKIEKERAYFPYRKETKLQSIPLDALEMVAFTSWENAAPGELICAFSTFYSVSRNSKENINRMYNIDQAVERLNGQILKTGEDFSFNAVCAPYTKENGYKNAPILSGTSDTGYGGGVCQVATTIYNVVLRVPTWVVTRHWHGQGGTKYIPAGFDATVGSRWDLVFTNVLSYDLRLEMLAQDGVMTAAFYRAEE